MRRKEERGKEEAGEDEREDGEGGELWDAGRVREEERVESGRDGEEAGGVRRQAGTGLKGWLGGREGSPTSLVDQTGAATCRVPRARLS